MFAQEAILENSIQYCAHVSLLAQQLAVAQVDAVILSRTVDGIPNLVIFDHRVRCARDCRARRAQLWKLTGK